MKASWSQYRQNDVEVLHAAVLPPLWYFQSFDEFSRSSGLLMALRTFQFRSTAFAGEGHDESHWRRYSLNAKNACYSFAERQLKPWYQVAVCFYSSSVNAKTERGGLQLVLVSHFWMVYKVLLSPIYCCQPWFRCKRPHTSFWPFLKIPINILQRPRVFQDQKETLEKLSIKNWISLLGR